VEDSIPFFSAQKLRRVQIIFFMSFRPQASKLIGVFESDSVRFILDFKIGRTFVRSNQVDQIQAEQSLVQFLKQTPAARY
jgi:hypothetical protein